MLLDTRFEEISHDQTLITLSEDCSVEDALEVLKKNHFLGAPVVSNSTNQVIGLIDVLDAVAYANHMYFEEAKSMAEAWKYESIAVSFRFQTVKNIIDLSRRNPFHPFYPDSPLQPIMRSFATGSHRVLIVDKENNNQPLNIYSQSDCVKFVSTQISNDPKLKEITEKQVIQLQIGRLPDIDNNIILYAIDSQELAINAFRLMHTAGVSGVGIEESGRIIGNLSASDLLGFLQNDFEMLQRPVCEFVDFVRHRNIEHQNRFKLVTCGATDTLAQVMQLFNQERLHRVYVKDRDDIIGVITLTDVIRTIYEALTGECLLPKLEDP